MPLAPRRGAAQAPGAAPAKLAPGEGQGLQVAVQQIQLPAYNPRRRLDEDALKDLAADILERGLINPVTLRPNPNVEESGCAYELVAGQRRLAAAKALGLTELPATVRQLDDAQAAELALAENIDRADLSIVEEARALEHLVVELERPVPLVADRLGRGAAFVRGRLALLKLTDAALEAVEDGRLPLRAAWLCARLAEPALIAEACAEALAMLEDDLSVRALEAALLARFTTELGSAGFALEDATLNPAAGPCTTCPFRTGNQAALFDARLEGDRCTRPDCFRGKRDAHFERLAALVREGGSPEADRVLEASRAGTVFYPHGGVHHAWRDVDAARQADPESRSLAQRADLGEVKVYLAQDPLTGLARRLVRAEDVDRLERKLTAEDRREERARAAEAPQLGSKERRRLEREQAARARELQVREDCVVEACRYAATLATTMAESSQRADFERAGAMFPALAYLVAGDAWQDVASAICKRRALKPGKSAAAPDALALYAQDLPAGDALALAVEIALRRRLERSDPKALRKVLACFGVDPREVEARSKRARAAPKTR